MQPLHTADLKAGEAVFTAVDGTLTTAGRLTSSALGAIERLVAGGVRVVLVSGRPAGWGEAWARELPVSGVVVENGGLYFAWRGARLHKIYAEAPQVRVKNRKALLKHVQAALKAVRGTKLSKDSAYTEVDLAIDYAEDAALGEAAAVQLEHFLRKRGVNAVRSSVHVNCWLGRFNKRIAVERFLKTEWKTAMAVHDRRFVYVGDSLNDEPMFEAFSLSIGVANVRDVLPLMESPPKFVTDGPEGRGFVELAGRVLESR